MPYKDIVIVFQSSGLKQTLDANTAADIFNFYWMTLFIYMVAQLYKLNVEQFELMLLLESVTLLHI